MDKEFKRVIGKRDPNKLARISRWCYIKKGTGGGRSFSASHACWSPMTKHRSNMEYGMKIDSLSDLEKRLDHEED